MLAALRKLREELGEVLHRLLAHGGCAIDGNHGELRTHLRHNRRLVEQQCSPKQLIGSVREEWNSPAVVFDSRCVDAVRQSVNGLGIKSLEMVSGAGHDSVYVSRVAPTAMIFVPCEGGLSHCETENAKPADLAAGCDVLLHTLLLLDEG